MLRKRRSAYLLEKLEPRLLFSADLALLPVDGGAPAADQDILLSMPLQVESEETQQHETLEQVGREIIFIDAGIEDYQQLLDDIQSQIAEGRQFETVLLDSNTDGIIQISNYLNFQQHISSVHIISHGSDGEVVLGNSPLNSTTLDSYAEAIEGWQNSLTGQADLLFYGCNLASGTDGQSLISSLALLTGADVAASDDVTGQTALGGDWDLEYVTGTIESSIAVSQNMQQSWAQQLFDSKAEFLVNTSTGGTQETSAQARGSEHAVAMDTAGNYVVVWSDSVSDSSGYGIFAQRFNAAGTAQGSEFQINQTTTDNQYWASVAMADNGTFTITWTSVNQDGTASSIYARKFNADGTPVAAEFRVNTQNDGGQTNSSIDMDENGDFIIVWQGRGSGDNDGIFFRRFNADGSAIDATDQLANQTDDGNEQDPVVTIQASGNFVIAWEISSDCYFQRFNSSGAVLGTKVKINGLGMLPTTSSRLAVDSDSSGNFTFVCREDAAFVGGIYHRAFNEDGTEKYSYSRIASGDATNPSISMDDAGNYLVTYEKTGDGSGLGVYGRQYDSTGSDLGSEFLINETTAGTQHMVSTAMLDFDNYIAVWSGNGSGDADGVYARQFGTGNTAPVAVADSFTVSEGSTTNLDLATNDSDADDGLDLTSITIVSGPSNGSIDNINADGTVDYTHDGSETLADSFTYTINDLAAATSNVVTVSITITPVNDVPTFTSFVGPATSGNEDSEITVTFGNLAVQGDEADADGTVDAFVVKLVTSGTLKIGGSAGTATAWAAGTNDTLNATTNAYWTPAADTNGTLNAFEVVAQDNDGAESVTNVAVQVVVNPTNDAPTVANPIPDQTATEDSAFTFQFAANTFYDADGDPLDYTSDASGWLSFDAATRTFSGTPLNSDVGTTTVTVTADDGNGGTISDTFAIVVSNVNDAPTITSTANTAATEDSPYSYTFGVNDVDAGDTLTLSAPLLPAWLSFNTTSGILSGTPTNAEVGTHNVILRVNDGTVDVDQSFTIMVTNVNDAPVAVADSFTVNEGSTTNLDLATNDSDADDGLDLTSIVIVSGPSNGTIDSINADGTVDYTHNGSETLTDSFTYTINDLAAATSNTVTVSITVTPVNDAPTITSTANTAATEDSPYSYTFGVNDVDAGDTLTLSAPLLPAWLSFNTTSGILSGTPTNAEVGTHNVILRVNDGTVDVDQSFTITVTNVNDAPTAINLDNLSVAENIAGVVIGNLSTSDIDAGDSHTYTVDDSRFEIVAGQLKLKARQSLDHETEPSVAISITSRDAAGLSISQGFTLIVTDANDNPAPVDDHLSGVEDNQLILTTATDLLDNDSDPDGDSLSLSSLTQPGHGSLVDNGDGTLTYTPTHNFAGTDSIDYTISDGQGGTASGTAFIVVVPVGDTPQVMDIVTLADTQSGLITISRNAADGAEVTHFRISNISGGTLFLADGTTQVNHGDYVSVAQGQAGLRFTPAAEVVEGHFQVEASEDGTTVAIQSALATATIRVVALPPISTPEIPVSGTEGLGGGGISTETIADTTEESATDTEQAIEQVTESAAEQPVDAQLPTETAVTTETSFRQTAVLIGNPFNSFIRQTVAHEANKNTLLENNTSNIKSLALELQTAPLETLKTAWNTLDISPLTAKDYDRVRKSFDAIQDEIDSDGKITNAVVSSAFVTSMGLSAGYVFWMLKGGSLLASVLSSMPAWHLADPLSILSGMRQDDEDDESLENIIEQGAQPTKDDKENEKNEKNEKK